MKKKMLVVCLLTVLICGTVQTGIYERGNHVYAAEVVDGKTDALHDPQGYIIPESDQRYLTEADVEGLSLQEINYAKNEIFARKGRKFLSVELQNYFNRKTWYEGLYEPEDFDVNYEAVLISDCEKANADFLAGIEHSIDADGYQLDVGTGRQQGSGAVTYDDILNEYKQAVSENFSNWGEYEDLPSMFAPDWRAFVGERIFYAYFDLMKDDLPELIISAYFEDAEEPYYKIIDVYGTDGKTVQKLDGGDGGVFNTYRFCENNILELHWLSGGMSAGGEIYFQLYPGSAVGEKIEELGHTGDGYCYKYDLKSPGNEQIWIQEFEYEEIRDSYLTEEIPFEWKEITA